MNTNLALHFAQVGYIAHSKPGIGEPLNVKYQGNGIGDRFNRSSNVQTSQNPYFGNNLPKDEAGLCIHYIGNGMQIAVSTISIKEDLLRYNEAKKALEEGRREEALPVLRELRKKYEPYVEQGELD